MPQMPTHLYSSFKYSISSQTNEAWPSILSHACVSRQFPDPRMDSDQAKVRVTELHVRMDCDGCVQRIKRALHGLEGVHEVYIDVARQKLTVVGKAEPEKVMKAVRKTRKAAILRSEQQRTEAAVMDVNPEAESEKEAPLKEWEEIRMVRFYGEDWNACRSEGVFHGYNGCRPSASVTEYSCFEDGDHRGRGGDDGRQITSLFSDENPNACSIS